MVNIHNIHFGTTMNLIKIAKFPKKYSSLCFSKKIIIRPLSVDTAFAKNDINKEKIYSKNIAEKGNDTQQYQAIYATGVGALVNFGLATVKGVTGLTVGSTGIL